MGLLNKALLYREQLLRSVPKGLLYKALKYLESKNSEFPAINGDLQQIDNHSEIDNKFDLQMQSLETDRELSSYTINEKSQSIDENNFAVDLKKDEIITVDNEPETIINIDEKININENINIDEDINIPEEIESENPVEIEGFTEETDEVDSDILTINDVENDLEELQEINSIEIPDGKLTDFKEDIAKHSEEVLEEFETVEENEVSDTADSVQSSFYFDIINNISKDMSTLIVDDIAYKKFNEIISNNFNFIKSALLIYFPPKQKFILWHGKNIDEETASKLSFDLEFNNIYRNLSKEKSYLIKKENDEFMNFSSLFSQYDFNESNFLVWIPFIFSARIIGIFLGMKLNEHKYPSNEMIGSMEIIGRLNGPLLYNLYQQETIKQQQLRITKDANIEKVMRNIKEEEKKEIKETEKKNQIEEIETQQPFDTAGTLDLDNYDKNQTDNIIVQLNDMEEIESAETLESLQESIPEQKETSDTRLTELDPHNEDLFDIFPENIHKLIYFAQQTISNSPDSPLTLIHIQFENGDEIQNLIPNFRFETFYSDIQFVIMNVVGTNGFVQILRDMNIYIVLPEIQKSMSQDILKEITEQLDNMFSEIHESVAISLKNKIANYPDDAKDYINLFYKIQNI
jgi:hypothetical protein